MGFKHPTIGDAYAVILTQSPELLGIFVQGSAPDKLVEQVTCGDVDIEKAVIIPKSLFPLMLDRLREFSNSKKHKSEWLSAWSAKSALQGFLARRCSKEFLSQYLEKNRDLLDRVSKPGLYLDSTTEVDLAVRLHEFRLLPEDKRKKFVATVSEYAVNGEDIYALYDEDIRGLFEDHEFEELLQNVRTQLLPKLDDMRIGVQREYRSGEPADEHMQRLLESLETLKKRFGDDMLAAEIIERETHLANDWIAENESEETDRKPRTLGKVESQDKPTGARSVFDDVDE